MGACPGTQPAIFTRVLALDERSGEGEGDTGRPTPSPQAAITIETSITRAPAELGIKSPSQFFARVLGERRAIRRGGGGKGDDIAPSPQAAITIETPFTRALSEQSIYLSIKSQCWPLIPVHAPPHARHPSPAHVFLPRDIRVFIWSPMPSTLLTTHAYFFSPISKSQSLYSLYVWNSARTADPSNIIHCTYILSRLKGHCIDTANIVNIDIKIPAIVVHPHTHIVLYLKGY